ncbi:Pyrophosphatase [Beijerinckiaceae bacterium RH AL1]|nr:nucleoside triphosphate pyrophosphohydrolase family protein [Beijerinckiaceae bacterium]VVB42662.1 Pyrophosphatase [Beijerinckiaceae bacterium RH AL8]VVB42669.1 Pyrophosphatase [Beijerinckiaceae bacterium RH CH11]VVC53434.1 Pyrophosphatase [Beijerinckiaceae bacterium RH AL1]
MMGIDYELLTVASYAKSATLTDQGSESRSLNFPLLGLYGETGSLLSVVKKKQRDSASYLGYAEAVVEELGDVLWYLTAVARRGGICLSSIAAGCLDSARGNWGRPDMAVTFEALQPDLIKHDGAPTPAFEATLLQLAGEVGAVLADHHAGKLDDNQAAFADHLVTVLRCLIKAANEAGVTLEAAAIKNITKIFDRWPKERIYPPFFDTTSDLDEQLPRSLVIDIFEKKVRDKAFVLQRCGGIFVGDRLTDNAVEPDDYRFHDVFHFAYVAVLGWSPVIRALLKLKRKGEPAVDEAQDGARATLIEEGVTTWIFGQAQRLNFFAGLKPGDLPLDMLNHVRDFVAGYEAAECPLWVWEEAILQGYAAFRFLQKHRRGRITVDLANRRLTIRELPI